MRDLEKDLALCEAATKGPWTVVPTKDNWGETHLPRIDAPNTIVLYFGAKMDYGDISGEEPEEADLAFIAASREGWPEAIRRAMAAEAEVEGLRDVLNVAADALRPFAYEDCGCKARLETGICHHVAAQVALLGLLSVGKAGDPA